MINTIFYFADTLPFSSYTEQIESGDISTQTIVFVRDTKSIYMGGQQYGSMTASDFRDLLSTVVRSGNSEVNTQIDNINTAIEQLQQNLQENVNQLNGSISNVSTLANNQKSRLDTILTGLDQQISDLVDQNIEDLNLGTAYAKKNDVGAILEWLYSGLKASSAEDKSYNQLVTAAKNDTLGTSAISELFTEIDALDNKYVAKTGFASSVDSAIAALLLEASNESSLMSIVNRVGANENNISAISSKMTGDNAYTEMLNALEDELNGTTAKSNVKSVVDSNAQTAAAQLFSTVSNDNDEITASSIASAITSNSSALAELGTHFVDANGVNTIVENKLTAAAGVANWTEYAALITEDHTAIGSLSSTVENLPDSSSIVTTSMISSITDTNGDITAASIIAKVNDSGSSVMLSADKILLDGTTFFQRLISEFDDKKITIGNGILEVESENLMLVRKWVHPSGDGAQFVPQLISLGEKIKIDGERIYNDPLTSYSNSDQTIVYKNPKWNIGYDSRWLESIGTQDIQANRVLALDDEAIDNSGQIEVITQGSDEDANHIYSIKSDDYYVISTENGLDQDGNDIPASAYIDGNLYVNGDATIGNSLTVVELNTYNGSGVNTTIDIPSTTSGKHYHMVIDCGIIIECNEVNDQ